MSLISGSPKQISESEEGRFLAAEQLFKDLTARGLEFGITPGTFETVRPGEAYALPTAKLDEVVRGTQRLFVTASNALRLEISDLRAIVHEQDQKLEPIRDLIESCTPAHAQAVASAKDKFESLESTRREMLEAALGSVPPIAPFTEVLSTLAARRQNPPGTEFGRWPWSGSAEHSIVFLTQRFHELDQERRDLQQRSLLNGELIQRFSDHIA